MDSPTLADLTETIWKRCLTIVPMDLYGRMMGRLYGVSDLRLIQLISKEVPQQLSLSCPNIHHLSTPIYSNIFQDTLTLEKDMELTQTNQNLNPKKGSQKMSGRPNAEQFFYSQLAIAHGIVEYMQKATVSNEFFTPEMQEVMTKLNQEMLNLHDLMATKFNDQLGTQSVCY
jgi:hypothetical protein